jgi:hypothetical protein
MAIRPGRKERHPAIFASGSHDFIVFQVVDKIIGFGNRGKAYRAEFFKSIIYFFYFTHNLSPTFIIPCSVFCGS